ncbi:MAG: OmpA family protein [Cryomorphaceae bacterium]
MEIRYHWAMPNTFRLKSMLPFILIALGAPFQALAQQDTLRVYFDHDEYRNFDAKPIDDRSLELQSVRGIIVVGYADHLGSNAYNATLSARRAESVARYLMSQGISKRSMSYVQGEGEVNGPEAKSVKGEPNNRRVDVIFPLTTTTPPPLPLPEPPVAQAPDEKEVFEIDSTTKVNIVLEGLSFIGGRHFPTQESMPTLEKLVETMKKYPQLEIEIQGHICCEYDDYDGLDIDAGTMNLSENRAKYVYKYLIQEGIAEQRMSFVGKGSSDPKIFPEKTELDRQANRRVELKIIKF